MKVITALLLMLVSGTLGMIATLELQGILYTKPYRPYGELSYSQKETEVLIHRTDQHKIYTCEDDPVTETGVYAVIDQPEALDAGYTPAGQGYCDIK